jgi:hypothetical protein
VAILLVAWLSKRSNAFGYRPFSNDVARHVAENQFFGLGVPHRTFSEDETCRQLLQLSVIANNLPESFVSDFY